MYSGEKNTIITVYANSKSDLSSVRVNPTNNGISNTHPGAIYTHNIYNHCGDQLDKLKLYNHGIRNELLYTVQHTKYFNQLICRICKYLIENNGLSLNMFLSFSISSISNVKSGDLGMVRIPPLLGVAPPESLVGEQSFETLVNCCIFVMDVRLQYTPIVYKKD